MDQQQTGCFKRYQPNQCYYKYWCQQTIL